MSDVVSIYVDGSCAGNPGEGGWAAYYQYKGIGKFIHGYEEMTTNNRMELTAAIKALENIKLQHTIKIYTDSVYLKNGITIWIKDWIKNNWRNSAKKEVKNSDLWRQLLLQLKEHDIEWLWVKAHTNNQDEFSLGNYLVDDLCVRSRKWFSYVDNK